MTAQIISLQQKREERGLPSISTGQMTWLDASLMLNPFAMMWLDSYGHAQRYATAPAIILEFTDEPA